MSKKKYQTPRMRVHEMEPASIICQSVAGSQNEKYEVGSTEGWF